MPVNDPDSFDVILGFVFQDEIWTLFGFDVKCPSLSCDEHRTGMAFRVPTPDVSVVDLTFTAEKADGDGVGREHT